MVAKARVEISWNYEPKDYFEEKYETRFENYTLTINEGVANVILWADEFDKDPTLRGRLDDHINSLFEGARLQSFESYSLSRKGIVTIIEPDGKKKVSLSGTVRISGSMTAKLDAIRYDENGKIILDTRKHRIAEKKKLAELLALWKGHDLLLGAILLSWENATKYSENEFAYLYEIREALKGRFGGDEALINALGVSKKEYSDFGRITNHEPLRQSRHRGKNITFLRDATQEELTQARAIAREFVIAYIDYLRTHKG